MAQSLPTATHSEIEHVTRLCQRLDFFVHQPPLAVSALSHGDSNQSYHIHTAHGDYVLRCYPADSAVCRQQELRCQHAAAAKGLAPAPLCLNNHYQIMISDYIAGAHPYNLSTQGLMPLLSTLVPFHLLHVQTPQLDCLAYLEQLQHGASSNPQFDALLFASLQQAGLHLCQLSYDEVLCHLDLHQGNILFANDRVWLLDFEYSQRADSSLDLAALSWHFQLDIQQQQMLLQQYVSLRQQPKLLESLKQKLPSAKIVYGGFCWLWYLAQPGCQAQAASWYIRLRQLLQSL